MAGRALTFNQCMKAEREYAVCEYRAVERKDYRSADYFHKLRWKCMDEAVKVAQEGVYEAEKEAANG